MLASEFGNCILKYKKYLAAFIALAILLCNLLMNLWQSYTSEVYIQYVDSKAESGLTENGQDMDPYEIANSFVVKKTLEQMGMENLDVTGIQKGIIVTPVVSTSEEEKYASWKKNFSDYDETEENKPYPTVYSVKFRTNKGPDFAAGFVGELLQQYRLFYAQKYSDTYDVIKLADEATLGYDYFETADMLKRKIKSNMEYIQTMDNQAPEFRSSLTGYSMSDLAIEYGNLMKNYLASVNRDILERGLTKDDVILKASLANKADAARLENSKYAQIAESKIDLMETYSQKNKEYTRGANYGSWGDESNQVREDTERDHRYNRDEMTYDNLMLEFVDYAVMRENSGIDGTYYDMYSGYFSNGSMTDPQVDDELKKICEKYNELHEITEKTVEDYNNYKSSKSVALISGVSTQKTISETIYYAITVVLATGLGVTFIVFMELSKKKRI